MKKVTIPNAVVPIMIGGTIITLSGVMFHLQSRAIIGPQSSFMYANPQWNPYGQYIAIVGVLIFVVGLILYMKRGKKNGK